MMEVTRISKDRYKITCCSYVFLVYKPDYGQYWHVSNDQMHIHRSCDDLAEVFDYLDFMFGA